MTCPLCAEELPPGSARCSSCGSRFVDEPAPLARPDVVTAVAALHLMVGAASLLWVPTWAFLQAQRSFLIPPGPPSWWTVAPQLGTVTLLSVVSLAAGFGLLLLRPWARPLAVACTLVASMGLMVTEGARAVLIGVSLPSATLLVVVGALLPIAELRALFDRSHGAAFERGLRRR